MKFRKASSLFLVGAMCLSTFGAAMSVFADEETSSEAAEAETVDYSAEDPITATITVWGPAEDQAEEYGSGSPSAAKRDWRASCKLGSYI